MAPNLSSQSEGKDKGGSSLLEFSRMAPTTLPSVSSSRTQESYETQWLENNTSNSIVNPEESNKDYYSKYEEDSGFRNFVKTLLRSKSGTNLQTRNKDNINSEKLHKMKDNKESISNGNTLTNVDTKKNCDKDRNPKISSIPKANDDISSSRGQYQNMVKDRWGQKRSLDSRIGGGRDVEIRPSSDLKESKT